jgi:hypothetical protein
MRKMFYVDRAMCGGDNLPDDFDLEEFCEVLQGKLQDDVEIVPVSREGTAVNRDGTIVSQTVFLEALGEYCPQ